LIVFAGVAVDYLFVKFCEPIRGKTHR
jgi:hypothetical protein